MAADRVRIVTNGLMAHDARVYLVRKDGEEIDISSLVTIAEVSVRVGDVNKVSLNLLGCEINVEGVTDVTSLADRVRQYTR